jgi:uncharacterized membrane protein YphA (DoxX/SURF4 family)
MVQLDVMPPLWLMRAAVAGVWIYEGLWCKVLKRSRHEFEVVEQVPLEKGTMHALLVTLGWVEIAVGHWVLSGYEPMLCAVAQVLLLVSLNTMGITFSRNKIHDPPGMVVKNAALLVLACVTGALGAAAAR